MHTCKYISIYKGGSPCIYPTYMFILLAVSSVLYPVSNVLCPCVLWAKAIADHFSHTKAQKQ